MNYLKVQKIAVNAAPTSLGYNIQTLVRAGLITLDDSEELLPTPSKHLLIILKT